MCFTALLQVHESTPVVWSDPYTYRIPLTVVYAMLLVLIGVYGLHRYWLLWTYNKHRLTLTRPPRRFSAQEMPIVTVQLPMFNEGAVAARIIDAACALDYPQDRLQIQVLDDSTDSTLEISRARVTHWQAQGFDIELLHRTDRSGYKAGALAAAMDSAKGEFLALFDADFVPPVNFLKRTVHHFTNASIGMVQTRWDHLNREDSLLTRSQAIFLDGHFLIEHTARNRSKRWFNFSGTGGVWRRTAIEDAGGWEHDTLTEDMDLSYRAQLAGWEFLYIPRVTCPAELPPEMNAFKSQQHRWTKGTVQTMRKMLPTILKSHAPLRCKSEAFFHLTHPLVYLYINLFVLLFYPAIALNIRGNGTWWGVIFGLSMFGLGCMSASAFYVASQRMLGKPMWSTLLQVPMLMSVGIGIALNNAVACVEALLGHESAFIRTPKYNAGSTAEPVAETAPASGSNNGSRFIAIPSLKKGVIFVELAFGAYMLWCAFLALNNPHTVLSLPFLVLFAIGYIYVGLSSSWIHLRGWLDRRTASPLPT